MTGLISDDGAVHTIHTRFQAPTNWTFSGHETGGMAGGQAACKGCKGKTPHFYQSDQISKKLSFVSN